MKSDSTSISSDDKSANSATDLISASFNFNSFCFTSFLIFVFITHQFCGSAVILIYFFKSQRFFIPGTDCNFFIVTKT